MVLAKPKHQCCRACMQLLPALAVKHVGESVMHVRRRRRFVRSNLKLVFVQCAFSNTLKRLGFQDKENPNFE